MMTPKSKSKRRIEVPVVKARAELRDLLNRVEFGGERIVITRHDEESAALVSIADLKKIEAA